MKLRYLDLDAFSATALASEPFRHMVVPGFVRAEACAEINRDYPRIVESGSFPADQLSYGPAFREFLDELASEPFRKAFEDKFDLFLGRGIDDLDALVGEQAHDIVEGIDREVCGIEGGRDVSCGNSAAFPGPCDQLRHLFR